MDRRTLDLLPAAALLAGGLVVGGAVTLSPKAGHSVMVVFGPGTAATEAVSRVIKAGWLPVASPRPFLVIARPDTAAEARRPDDAYLLLDARAMSGCQPQSSESSAK
ncbi:hypothetical protein N825_13230 [Skermanella stibiiresistens SB22]|uniref:Uncharacterized protein n=1 Tax=Skermanella stibiiresistens SB22 TaxID=1385369 RepID=W9H111_9PROT|nr:hypothetical protein [Skermanella stibiiresistens]EWY38511.1 hypothetical protein N825_13230 [Skermanella stibiiresistens SB22]